MAEPNCTADHAVIVGLGLMGCDIAALFLAGGWRVTAIEPDLVNWAVKRERVRSSLIQLEAAPALDAHLTVVASLGDVHFADAAVVIEAVPERLDLKRATFVELDRLVPPGIPVATNASGFRVTDVAEGCATRARMANLHFFFPAHLVPGVEVVRGADTDPAICERLAEIMAGLGHQPIRVQRDIPGFLANRIQHALMREAWSLIDQGFATADDIDAAVRYAFGFRYLSAGPILQKELAGLETQLSAAATIYPSLCNDTEPAGVLKDLVAKNHLGAKTGKGLREWPPGRVAEARARSEHLLIAASRMLRAEAKSRADRETD